MKFFKKILTIAALTALPAVVQAQIPLTSLTISNSGPGRVVAGGNGGRFEAVAIGPMLSPSPQNILVFCVEQDRFFTPGTTYTNYQVFTFTQFLALNYRGVDTMGDLNQMVNNAGIISLGAGAAANTAQNDSWAVMAGTSNYPAATANTAGWYVLSNAVKSVDQSGRVSWSGNQTFIARVEVPEPSSFAIMTVGLVGLGLVGRRRRSMNS